MGSMDNMRTFPQLESTSKYDIVYNIEVTGCQGCPLFEFDIYDRFDECKHPDASLPNHTNNIPDGLVDDDKTYTPSWCPLKVEPITIKLKENGR